MRVLTLGQKCLCCLQLYLMQLVLYTTGIVSQTDLVLGVYLPPLSLVKCWYYRSLSLMIPTHYLSKLCSVSLISLPIDYYWAEICWFLSNLRYLRLVFVLLTPSQVSVRFFLTMPPLLICVLLLTLFWGQLLPTL